MFIFNECLYFYYCYNVPTISLFEKQKQNKTKINLNKVDGIK